MKFNRWARQFLRREEAECFIDTIEFPPLLELVGFHTFLSMINDPDIEVLELFDLEDDGPFSLPEKTGVTWMARGVGGRTTRLIPLAAYALVRCGVGGLEGLPLVLHIEVTEAGGVRISLSFRQDDVDHRLALKNWADRCERLGNPFVGRKLVLSRSGVDFLPSRKVESADLILPEIVMDTLSRDFAFLTDPGGWPEGLRHRAVLLAGAPGLGKSLAARWLADSLEVTTLWVTGGVLCDIPPAAIFDWARRLKPVLLILEDLGVALGPDADPRRFGDFLGEMDGFTDHEGVGILATTNDLEGLDPALNPRTRPGRFHRLIELEPPDRVLRQALIERHCGLAGPNIRPSEAMVAVLAEATTGFTGAQIVETIDEACSRVIWAETSGEKADADDIFENVLSERSRPSSVGFVACGRSA
jgi:hypothetical protein